MDGIRRVLGMSDESIRQAEQERIDHDGLFMKIQFNRSKKLTTDSFVELSFKPADMEPKETIEQDFHY